MTFADFLALVKQRRSIHYFADAPVKKEQIEQLMEVARLAPSVENSQPWHFHVILNPALRRQMTESCCYGNFVEGAGVFIVVSCDRSVQSSTPEIVWNERELEYSCIAAMMQVMLGATAMGLGSCMVSLHHGHVHELLKLPTHISIVDGMMIGNFKKGEEEGGDHHQRKSLKEIVTFY